MKHRVFFCVLLLLSQTLQAQIEADSPIEKQMEELHIPGLATAKIENGTISWLRYYGFQDIDQKKPVSSETVFHIASISKTVTAAAIMQLHAKGYLNLDDDINRFLPYRVVNPSFPKATITFRQLLRHRSSIADNLDYLLPFWESELQGKDMPLDVFLRDYLMAGGKNYHSNKNFVNVAPGDQFAYSNVGYALLGYLVERISKMPFDRYCKTHLFDPLGMSQTSWFPHKFPDTQLATPYSYSDSLKTFIKNPQGKYPDYPAGQLRCTLKDLATFLACWSNDENFNGRQIISAKAVQTLTPKDMSLGFHTWFMYLLSTEAPLYSHSGNGPGISTYMLFDPFSKKGLIVLMNGELSDYFKWRTLIATLYNDTKR